MIYAIIQARMGSSRLPGKVLLDLGGKPVLARVLERVNKSKRLDQVMVATTDQSEDDAIADFCAGAGYIYYRGSANDVLDRYYQAAKFAGAGSEDAIIRITADCPLIDPGVIDEVIGLFVGEQLDYASNVDPPTFPDGLDVEVMTFNALERAWLEASKISEREHVTPYIRNQKDLFRQMSYSGEQDISSLRWTLDEPADYTFLQRVYTDLSTVYEFISTQEILAYLVKNPDVAAINQTINRNEGYIKSLAADKEG